MNSFSEAAGLSVYRSFTRLINLAGRGHATHHGHAMGVGNLLTSSAPGSIPGGQTEEGRPGGGLR